MALVVNTNVPSIASQRFLMESRKEMETSMERLSSGLRINSAADDAAGLAISTRMDTQIRGLNVAIRNANDGISLTQTAEGAMQEVTDMLQRMRELAMQAAHAVNNDADREALDAEVQQLKSEIDRVAGSTEFNGQNILDGSFNRQFQIGPDTDDTIRIGIGSVNTQSLGMVGETENDVSNTTDQLISSRLNVSAITIDEGDVTINGQELAAFDGSAGGAAEDIYDLITNISTNIDNVEASAFNTVVAKTIGSGVVRAEQVAIKVGAIGASGDDWYQAEKTVVLGSSDSLEEMVANINREFVGNEVVASINDDGKLVLSNNTGATISIADESGTTNAFDGATGFVVDQNATVGATGAGSFQTTQQAFLRLTSTDESPIEIEAGNQGLASPGTSSDVQALGFNSVTEDPTGNYYTLTGTRMTTAALAETIGKNSTTEQADLTINGVEIYDELLTGATNTFQGKLDMINAFSDETGVVASAHYERVFDLSNVTYVADDTLDINGTTISVGANATALAANINAVTASTGLTAELDGQNLILKGDGIQNVDIASNDYTLAATNAVAARRSADVAAMTQIISFSAGDVTEGRVLQITVDVSSATDPDGTGNDVNILGLTAGTTDTVTFSHTVTSGQSRGDVHEAFRDLMNLHVHETDATATFSEGQYFELSADGSTLTVTSAAAAGEATITLGVDQTDNANRALYNGSTMSYVDHGAIRLQSTDLSPISIEFSESGAEQGFIETNVGDTTYDVNSATFQMTGSSSSMVSGLSVSTGAGATSAIDTIDAAIQMVSDTRSNLGAIQNRLDHTISNLSNVVENTSASKSRIMDADFAAEAASLARAQVLQQAGTAMLAQANAAPQNVLSLLG